MDLPKIMSKKEYDEFRARLEKKYGYEDMSNNEKVHFDSTIAQVAVDGDEKELQLERTRPNITSLTDKISTAKEHPKVTTKHGKKVGSLGFER